MKELEKLLKLAETRKNKSDNFMSFEIKTGEIRFHEDYQSAKNFVDQGGQVLVIDKQKVYNYKVKTDNEYFEYLSREIKKENYRKMNYYGL